MINKNFYRKTNDKKILHKVGKQWKVVSVALLMAVAGGAVAATHANANADANVSGATPYAANQAQFKPQVASAKSAAPKSASASVTYYPEASGSAAMYFDKVASDNAVAAKNYNTVNSYVQSLNNEYNPQVNSFSAKSASASSAASHDAKMASSYKATNDNPNTTKTINSLAAQHHMMPQFYQGMVQAQEQNYSGEVSSASADVKAASDVTSLVNRLEGANLNSASMSASAAFVVAQSNVNGARAVYNSVAALSGTDKTGILTAANELSYAASELAAPGNTIGYNADLSSVASVANISTTDNNYASLSNAFSSAVTSAVSSANYELNSVASSEGSIVSYASNSSHYNDLVSNVNNAPTFLNGNALNAYSNGVSAATNINFYGQLASLASSLYGKYEPQAANYTNQSNAFSEMKSSASAALLSAEHVASVAGANDDVIGGIDAKVSYNVQHSNVTSAEAAAQVANNLLQGGVQSFEAKIGYIANPGIYDVPNINGAAYSTAKIVRPGEFINALYNAIKGNSYNLSVAQHHVQNILNVIAQGNNDKNSVASELNSAASVLNEAGNIANNAFASDKGHWVVNNGRTNNTYVVKPDHNTTDATENGLAEDLANYINNNSNKNAKANVKAFVKAVLGDFKSTYGMTKSNSVSAGSISASLSSEANALTSMASAASAVSAESYTTTTKGHVAHTLKTSNGLEMVPVAKNDYVENNDLIDDEGDYGDYVQAALLSDGVDLDALSDEANGISHVASAESSIAASSADVKNDKNSNEKLNNALSAAASSANSALGSAQNASNSNSAVNDDDVTLASYFATSYSNAGNSESAVATSASSALNDFFKDMANDTTFNVADDAYADAEANAANDKKMGVEYSKVVYNNAPHFLDVLKGAKLHSSYDFGSNGDKVIGSVNKGDRLSVLGVNFNRNGLKHGATRYLVLDNTTGKKGFFTGQPQYSKAAYLNATSADAGVNVKLLKPVTVYDNLNGGKAVKTLKANTVVNDVTVVRDNPDNDAMGYTKVETPDYNFFTANTDYVEVLKTPVNNQPSNNYSFNLSNINLAKAYNNDSQY